MSPSTLSPPMGNIATIRTPSNATIERVETATVSVDGDINVASALDFPISLPQHPGGDFPVNESLNLSDIPSVELEPGWISWLIGDNFDLDAVNSSLLQATTGDFLVVDRMPDEDPLATDSFSVGPQATDTELAQIGDAIKEAWHTHCGQTTSGVISPDRANDRNQIDETYRHELSKRLEQRVQTGILPSTTFLLAKIHHHEPCLRPATERLPIISSDKLFAASSANAWRELVLQQTQQPGSRSMRERSLRGESDFQLCATLESISAMACECREPLSTTPHMPEKCQEMLLSWYETHLSTVSPGVVWEYPLRILWHSTFILLYSDLDALERACGRDGPEAAQGAIEYARQWASSQEATGSLIHAICIRKYFESMSIGSECPLQIPTCLYHCGIIWFCFGQFGDSSNGALMDRSFPELDLAGVHVAEIHAAELRNSQVERKAVNQVFRIVGLLQSMRHWKLSLSLASTLLALIEAQDNVY
ncbi:uncharacterized protein N7482_005891 [Penicillium canariense]|uniref:Transcription factor domain-containing protein n=1 Tax=Penicillium canariense TaxID=189055 RepID=A0A9W9LNM1_9EURO|nr:uncharacterized protein N7482_005891 [Penicillium canariense]KAJ5167110.1 hypothetical protein N7482_005891 [Penicillium canariense]